MLADFLGRESPLRRRVAGLVGQAEGGHHEAPVAVGLEQIEGLLVGEVGVIDDAEAMPHAHLHGLRAARVRAHPHRARPRDLHGRRHLGVGHHRALGAAVARARVA